MRLRIVIDTQDAHDPEVLGAGTPFTLNVYKDDEDGTPAREPLDIGSESCLVGGSIPKMLNGLAQHWGAGAVVDHSDTPMPRTEQEWRARQELDSNPCDQCDDNPATKSWSNLTIPVQMCDHCTHNALRSGWEPGA
jgi:hypothetical protein